MQQSVPGRRARTAVTGCLVLVAMSLLLGACDRRPPPGASGDNDRVAAATSTDSASSATSLAAGSGNAAAGKQALVQFGCGSCHTIPGVRGASAMVGPPLNAWSRRSFIAGSLPNTAPNLIHWIVSPQAVEPGTAMPDLGVSERQAQDMAAYLYTLR